MIPVYHNGHLAFELKRHLVVGDVIRVDNVVLPNGGHPVNGSAITCGTCRLPFDWETAYRKQVYAAPVSPPLAEINKRFLWGARPASAMDIGSLAIWKSVEPVQPFCPFCARALAKPNDMVGRSKRVVVSCDCGEQVSALFWKDL